jgi:ankyrin repeat protein
VLRALLDAGAPLEDRDVEGRTALMWAAAENPNPQVVVALLAAGADAGAKDIGGQTALDLARGNEALFETPAYWQLNDALFAR